MGLRLRRPKPDSPYYEMWKEQERKSKSLAWRKYWINRMMPKDAKYSWNEIFLLWDTKVLEKTYLKERYEQMRNMYKFHGIAKAPSGNTYPYLRFPFNRRLSRRIKAARAFWEFYEHYLSDWRPAIFRIHITLSDSISRKILRLYNNRKNFKVKHGIYEPWSIIFFKKTLAKYLNYLRLRGTYSLLKELEQRMKKEKEKGEWNEETERFYAYLKHTYSLTANNYFWYIYHRKGKYHLVILYLTTCNPHAIKYLERKLGKREPLTPEEYFKVAHFKGSVWDLKWVYGRGKVEQINSTELHHELTKAIKRTSTAYLPKWFISYGHSKLPPIYEFIKKGMWANFIAHQIYLSGQARMNMAKIIEQHHNSENSAKFLAIWEMSSNPPEVIIRELKVQDFRYMGVRVVDPNCKYVKWTHKFFKAPFLNFDWQTHWGVEPFKRPRKIYLFHFFIPYYPYRGTKPHAYIGWSIAINPFMFYMNPSARERTLNARNQFLKSLYHHYNDY